MNERTGTYLGSDFEPQKSTKDNKTFMLLSALGIIFVLDDHIGTSLHLFSNIFPYNSFFMPLFVFISGYFFKVANIENIRKYLIKKTKTFLIPYLGYNLAYIFLSKVLCEYTPIEWAFVTKDFLKVCWTYGTPVDLSSPGWFVMMLFHVVCVYALLRKLFNKIWNDLIVLLVCMIIGSYSVYISHYNYFSDNYLLVLKVSFFIQFYQLGICWKKYFESLLNRIPEILILFSTVMINIVLIYIYGEKINFISCAFMRGFITNNYLLPFVTSCTGILFWLTIASKLTLFLSESKVVNCISNNTFFIMMNHLLFFNMLSGVFGIIIGENFDKLAFLTNAWYKYMPIPQLGVVYILVFLICLYFYKELEYRIKMVFIRRFDNIKNLTLKNR